MLTLTFDQILAHRLDQMTRAAARSLAQTNPALVAEFLANSVWVVDENGMWWPPVWDCGRANMRPFTLLDALHTELAKQKLRATNQG